MWLSWLRLYGLIYMHLSLNLLSRENKNTSICKPKPCFLRHPSQAWGDRQGRVLGWKKWGKGCWNGEKGVQGDPSTPTSPFCPSLCQFVCSLIYSLSEYVQWTTCYGPDCVLGFGSIKINKTQPLPLGAISPRNLCKDRSINKSLQNSVVHVVIEIHRW